MHNGDQIDSVWPLKILKSRQVDKCCKVILFFSRIQFLIGPWSYSLSLRILSFIHHSFWLHTGTFSIILPYRLKGEVGNTFLGSCAAASCQRYLRSLGSIYISSSQGLFKFKPKACLIKEPFETHGCLFYFSII